MPREGNVQVVVVPVSAAANASGSAVVEIGARGEAVEILGIHFGIEQFVSNATQVLHIGLSTNPSHELTPPVSTTAFLTDKAIYGSMDLSNAEVVGAAGIWQATVSTNVIPLYGIIRPRRQILVWRMEGPGVPIRSEIYYRPLNLNKTDLDALNLKYGKYRRGA